MFFHYSKIKIERNQVISQETNTPYGRSKLSVLIPR